MINLLDIFSLIQWSIIGVGFLQLLTFSSPSLGFIQFDSFFAPKNNQERSTLSHRTLKAFGTFWKDTPSKEACEWALPSKLKISANSQFLFPFQHVRSHSFFGIFPESTFQCTLVWASQQTANRINRNMIGTFYFLLEGHWLTHNFYQWTPWDRITPFSP